MNNIDPPNENNPANGTVELLQFHKWQVIIPELKNHAISYFDGPTQFNYSQCSKLCNQEMQRFDNREPEEITLTGCWMISTVEFSYSFQNKFHTIQSEFEYETSSDQHKWTVRVISSENDKTIEADENRLYEYNAISGATDEVKRRCRRLKQELTCDLDISTYYWPSGLEDFFLERCVKCNWTVELTEGILSEFIDFAASCPDGMKMTISSSSYSDFPTIPRSLCHTRLFIGSKHFCCCHPIVVDDQQFLQCNAELLELCCSTISDQAIHQKIKNCLRSTPENIVSITVYSNNDEPRTFDRQVIFGDLQFEKADVLLGGDYYGDGESFITTEGNTSVRVKFSDNSVQIKVFRR